MDIFLSFFAIFLTEDWHPAVHRTKCSSIAFILNWVITRVLLIKCILMYSCRLSIYFMQVNCPGPGTAPGFLLQH